MIFSGISANNWSKTWSAIKVRDDHYYLEHNALRNIISTRIYCVSIDRFNKSSVVWPDIVINLGGKYFKCKSNYIERALDLRQSDIKETLLNKKKLHALMQSKVEFFCSQLKRLNSYCEAHHCSVSTEILLKVIRTIENNQNEWLKDVAASTSEVLVVSDAGLPIIVTTKKQIVIEFPRDVEFGTGKVIHEAFNYLNSEALVCIRPLDFDTWHREIQVQKLFFEAHRAGHNVSGFMLSDEICEEFAIQERLKGDLLKTIQTLGPRKKLAIAARLAKIVWNLHQIGIVHCDLKLDNILCDAENRVYLTDFGFARSVKKKVVTGTCGTQGMVALEYLKDGINFHKTGIEGPVRDFRKFDSFSFGVMLWNMCYEKMSPFDDLKNKLDVGAIEARLDGMERLSKPEKGTVGRVMRGLMRKNPDKRWVMAKACLVLDDIEQSDDPRRGFANCFWFPPKIRDGQ